VLVDDLDGDNVGVLSLVLSLENLTESALPEHLLVHVVSRAQFLHTKSDFHFTHALAGVLFL